LTFGRSGEILAASTIAEEGRRVHAGNGGTTRGREARRLGKLGRRVGRSALTEHRAYLQPTPDGNLLVLVVYEGPGSDGFLASMAQSDQEFDQWFIATVADIHGMDTSAPLPPMASRKL